MFQNPSSDAKNIFNQLQISACWLNDWKSPPPSSNEPSVVNMHTQNDHKQNNGILYIQHFPEGATPQVHHVTLLIIIIACVNRACMSNQNTHCGEQMAYFN